MKPGWPTGGGAPPPQVHYGEDAAAKEKLLSGELLNTVECIVDGRKETRRIECWGERVLPGEFQIGSGYSPSIYGRPYAVPEMKAGETVEYDLLGKPHITTLYEPVYGGPMATHYHTGTQTAASIGDWYYLDDNTTGGVKYRFEHVPPSLENPLGVIQVKIKEEEKMKQEENKFLAKLTRGMEEDQIDALYEILEQPGWEKRVMLASLASAVRNDNMTMEVLGYEKSEE